jgi:hypothetical protein
MSLLAVTLQGNTNMSDAEYASICWAYNHDPNWGVDDGWMN